jgi:hypothetical protein
VDRHTRYLRALGTFFVTKMHSICQEKRSGSTRHFKTKRIHTKVTCNLFGHGSTDLLHNRINKPDDAALLKCARFESRNQVQNFGSGLPKISNATSIMAQKQSGTVFENDPAFLQLPAVTDNSMLT